MRSLYRSRCSRCSSESSKNCWECQESAGANSDCAGDRKLGASAVDEPAPCFTQRRNVVVLTELRRGFSSPTASTPHHLLPCGFSSPSPTKAYCGCNQVTARYPRRSGSRHCQRDHAVDPATRFQFRELPVSSRIRSTIEFAAQNVSTGLPPCRSRPLSSSASNVSSAADMSLYP